MKTYRDQMMQDINALVELNVITNKTAWKIAEHMAFEYSEDCAELSHMKVYEAVDMVREEVML